MMITVSYCGLVLVLGYAVIINANGSDLLWQPCDVYGCNYGATCNRTTLECNCADEDTQVGPRCQTAGGECSQQCHVLGTVQGADGAECDRQTGKCICTSGFTGTDCSTPRVFATCDDAKLVIQITPFDYVSGSEFRGRIFGSPSDSFSSLPEHCTFSAAAGVYGLELSYDFGHRACGAPTETTDFDGVNIREFFIYIQHNTDYQLYSDHKFRVTCKTGESDTVTPARPAGIEDVTVHDISHEESTRTLKDEFKMELMHEDFTGVFVPITSPLSLADPVALNLQYKKLFSVHQCVASDQAGEDGTQIALISDWCVPNSASPLYRGAIGHNCYKDVSAGDTVSVHIPLQAWHFPNTTRLYITCDICLDQNCSPAEELVCEENELDDELVSKTHGLTKEEFTGEADIGKTRGCHMKRRRNRDKWTTLKVNAHTSSATKTDEESVLLPEGNNNQLSLTVSFVVNDPNDIKEVEHLSAWPEQFQMNSCYKDMSVIIPLVALTTLLMVISICGCLIRCHKNGNLHRIKEQLVQRT